MQELFSPISINMYSQPTYFDDIIPKDQHKDISEWCLDVKWYAGILKMNHQNDFDPRGDNTTSGVIRSMWRHPIGWDTKSTMERNPLIYKLWTDINDRVFNSLANLDGIPEGIGGLGIREKSRGVLNKMREVAPHLDKDILTHTGDRYSDGKDFYDKYSCPRDMREFTCYLNAREGTPNTSHSRSSLIESGILGSIHKDSGPGFTRKDQYYTVLYIANAEWKPSWGNEYFFYGDEPSGEKQWKHLYNIGWPNQIIGNRPGRIVVYPHYATHRTSAAFAPTPSYRIAFRVKIPETKHTLLKMEKN